MRVAGKKLRVVIGVVVRVVLQRIERVPLAPLRHVLRAVLAPKPHETAVETVILLRRAPAQRVRKCWGQCVREPARKCVGKCALQRGH